MPPEGNNITLQDELPEYLRNAFDNVKTNVQKRNVQRAPPNQYSGQIRAIGFEALSWDHGTAGSGMLKDPQTIV